MRGSIHSPIHSQHTWPHSSPRSRDSAHLFQANQGVLLLGGAWIPLLLLASVRCHLLQGDRSQELLCTAFIYLCTRYLSIVSYFNMETRPCNSESTQCGHGIRKFWSWLLLHEIILEHQVFR